MLNNIARLEIKIGERSYQFLCEIDSPLGEVHDALSQMKVYIINKMKDIESPPQQEEKQNG